MSNQRRSYQPKFASEIRLGLVVYGSVSLAIYIHGICQEFYHAVRGRGIYKLVKALTDSDLIVDTISGSSAGGINGVLLSYALTNSNDRELVDFSSFASIWRHSGDVLRLIHQPNLFRDRSRESGFFEEDSYQRELFAILAKLGENKLPRSRQEWLSNNQELDLFITGTDYLGRVDRRVDETGRHVGVKDHHVLFHLKHRLGRKEPLNPHFQDPNLSRTPEETWKALAKLCRITAGFPAIFPLVEIDLQNRHNAVDRQLVVWGNLNRNYLLDSSLDRNHKLYFLDGGLLDNNPFTCTIKETYYRLSNRLVHRQLFYVDPTIPKTTDVSKFSRFDRHKSTDKKKNKIDRVLEAAVYSIPIDQSINNDLRAIQEHNHKVLRYQSSIDRAEAAVNSQQILDSEDRTQSQIYLRGRLFDFRDRNLPLLLQSDLSAQNNHSSAISDKIDRIISSKPRNKQEQKYYHKLLSRFEPQTINLDVEYSIRQHFYLIDRIHDLFLEDLDLNTKQQLQHLSQQIGCNIKLLEVVRASLDLLLQDRAVSNYFYYLANEASSDRRLHALVYELIFRFHRFLLDGTKLHTFIPERSQTSNLETIPVYFWLDLPELASQHSGERWLSQTRISSVFAQLKQRITDLHQSTDLHRLIWMDRQLEYDNDCNRSFPSILIQISSTAEVLIERSANQYTPQLLKKWHTFDCIDRELYPLEYLTSLKEKELINLIEISPDNAQLGMGKGKTKEEKVAGNKLYNIGGFFKKSWRSNDLLWGRLDGLNRIIEGTVTPESVTAFANFVARETVNNNCSQTQYLDWLITESLPHISGNERRIISQHLEQLAQPQLRIDRSELSKILADLVLAGHREILNNNVYSIIEDIEEQPGWWRSPKNNQTSTENWILNKISFQTSSLPAIKIEIIGKIIQKSLANLSIQQKNFFHHQYRIGVDKLWENMPLVTLISVCTKIILILRNLLVRLAGISARNQPNIIYPLYHWLDGMLQSAYWWLQGGSIRLGAVHRRPRIIMVQFLGLATALSGLVLAFLLSPFWLLLSLPGAITCWFLQTMRLKRLTAVKTSPFLPQSREE